MKRRRGDCDDEKSVPVKRSLTHSTLRGELDKEFHTISWLDCEVRNERVKKVDEVEMQGMHQVSVLDSWSS